MDGEPPHGTLNSKIVMKIKDMEPQIEKLGLRMLEVRLKEDGEVHFFICTEPNPRVWDEDDSCNSPLIVFDSKGKCWIAFLDGEWQMGQTFHVYEMINPINGKENLTIEKTGATRHPDYDLKNIIYDVPETEEAVYEEI